MTPISDADLEFFALLRQHIGLLGVEYEAIDSAGKPADMPRMLSCSGFFIVLDGHWYFVTAGHAFQRSDGEIGLWQALQAGSIRIKRSFIADYFGPGAQQSVSRPLPTIVDFENVLSKSIFMEDDAAGLDFAFLPLRDFYADGIRSNGVVPLTETLWQQPAGMKYVLVGFPDEEKTPSPSNTGIDAAVRPCFARMDRCQLPSHLAKPTLPYVAAMLPDPGPTSPKGFSGSPIFAVDIDTEQDCTHYSLIAIDYKWHPAERIVVGCLMTDVVAEFRKRRAAARHG